MFFQVDVRPSEGDNVQGRETAEMRQLPETEIRNILKPRESKPKQVLLGVIIV